MKLTFLFDLMIKMYLLLWEHLALPVCAAGGGILLP